MSRQPYQRMGETVAGSSSTRQPIASPVNSRSPRESQAADKHKQRFVEDQQDPQAPWLTHLEYSTDPLNWDADDKYKACPLCNIQWQVTMMGSGRHHCRMCGILCCASCSRGALDLPGYDDAERVCEPCLEFTHYHRGDEPIMTEIWLAQSLLLVCWKDKDGLITGVPINQIQSVETGFSTNELTKRKTNTVMCCFSSENSEFAAKEPCLFSLLLTDGRTLDFESSTPALRNEWVERLRGLCTCTSKFVEYHFDVAQYKVHELIKKEKTRLSPANIKRMMDQEKSAQRASRNTKSDALRQKYAAKRG